MPGKSKVDAPPPSMADVIRQRAYQMWGVAEEEAPKKRAGGTARGKAKAAAKQPKKKAGKSKPAK